MTAVIWLVHISLISAGLFLLWRRQTSLRVFFWPAAVTRLVSGVGLGLLYTYYYPASDTFIYFSDASVLSELARRDPASYLEVMLLNRYDTITVALSEPRAFFLTKIISVINLFTGDRYWLTSFYFSLSSFFAAWYLVKTINRHIPTVNRAAALAFLFLPSVAFWTSGIIKESLAMAGIFFLTAFFLKVFFNERPRPREYFIAVLGLFVAWNLKYYYLAALIPVFVATFSYRYLFGKRFNDSLWRELLVWSGIFVIPLTLITLLHPNFHLTRLAEVIVSNNAAYNQFSDPGDVVHFDGLVATPASILIHAPKALFSGLFRPFFWEANSLTQFIAGIENAFLLLLFLAGLVHVGKYPSSPQRLLVFATLVYVVLLTVFITLSAPNFGTMSRYRVGYLSYFAFIILCDNPLIHSMERSFSRLVSH